MEKTLDSTMTAVDILNVHGQLNVAESQDQNPRVHVTLNSIFCYWAESLRQKLHNFSIMADMRKKNYPPKPQMCSACDPYIRVSVPINAIGLTVPPAEPKTARLLLDCCHFSNQSAVTG